MLFMNLPKRSIALLEDIYSAGLKREDDKKTAPKIPKAKEERTNKETNVVEALTKAVTKANQKPEEEPKNGKISLSGLLNIIDGVASYEGRVLVMTTNHPEKLDKALIRPGRVDHQVAFKNATQNQAKELFERMYTQDISRTTKTPSAPFSSPPSYSSALSTAIILRNSKQSSAGNGNLPTPPPTPPIEADANGVANSGMGRKEELEEEELIDMARKFAA